MEFERRTGNFLFHRRRAVDTNSGAGRATVVPMAATAGGWSETRRGALWLLHSPEVDPDLLLIAIERHRENVARGRDYCEHVGPGSSVSRVHAAFTGRASGLDLAVKWNHWRGWRGAASDGLRRSRARRALLGAQRLFPEGLCQPEPLAIAERRRGPIVLESFLFTRFLAGSQPLSAAMPGLQGDPRRRRAVLARLGDVIGRLHAAGLDHRDLKHSNLLLTDAGDIALLDLDSLVPPRAVNWRRRVRALGQLEAYATDLYPWLPRTDRIRFLRAYLEHQPELIRQRRRLIADVHGWADERRLQWSQKDRSDSMRYPLKPR